MLEFLRIENLVLVRHAEIRFGTGLNVLTGETGSGKSAILSAIRLLCGMRADSQLLCEREKPAIIEGQIRIKKLELPDLEFFCENGLCTLRRELLPSGKSRAFLNDRLISLSDLRKLTQSAIEFADQNEARDLLTPASQRSILDLWAGIDPAYLARSYEKQRALQTELSTLLTQKEQAESSLDRIAEQIREIEEANWREKEDEELAAEHRMQAESVERAALLTAALLELSEQSLPALFKRIANRISSCGLQDAAASLQSASAELLEAERLLEKALSDSEPDEKRLEEIEQRIAEIERLKRKYGKTFEEVQTHLQTLKSQLLQTYRLEEQTTALQDELNALSSANLKQAQDISLQRREKAKELQACLLQDLHALHLPDARLNISIEEKPLGPDGLDSVRFFFSANKGQPLQPLEGCASGGEQSRIFFALKSALAKKEERTCLVLDEIDSNIGGVAASTLGAKLKELGSERQLICITHFVQTAQFASHHFLVEKTTDATTQIRQLLESERNAEYARMMGSTFIPK